MKPKIKEEFTYEQLANITALIISTCTDAKFDGKINQDEMDAIISYCSNCMSYRRRLDNIENGKPQGYWDPKYDKLNERLRNEST